MKIYYIGGPNHGLSVEKEDSSLSYSETVVGYLPVANDINSRQYRYRLEQFRLQEYDAKILSANNARHSISYSTLVYILVDYSREQALMEYKNLVLLDFMRTHGIKDVF